MDVFWNLFWWLFGLVGIGGLVAIWFFWPIVVGTKLGRTLVAVGLAVLGALAVLARVRQEGIDSERKRQAKENADFLARQKERDAAIAGSSDADLDKLLHDSREPSLGATGGKARVPNDR